MKPIPDSADTLIHPGWIIPVIPENKWFIGHSLAIKENRIVAVLPRDEAAGIQAKQTLELPNHALLPGLINAHGHTAMSLLRGYADDQPLVPWLEQHIWPAEANHVSAEFVRDGAELAIAEMIRAGTTTFSDMYFFPDICAQVASDVGMRCQITFPVLDFPTVWAQHADEYIRKGLALRDDVKHNDLITVGFGPHSTYTVSQASLAKVATLAAELDIAVHIHLHETPSEVQEAITRNSERPLNSLHKLGLLGPKTQCVHMTELVDDDIALLAATGAHVIHCPQSNMKLASGGCPVAKLKKAGINVALGTDGAASNNDLNLFGEMQSAAMLAKLLSQDATVITAGEALAMATINGARALGIDEQVGSLETGKLADIIAVDLSQPETLPLYNPLSQLVYATNGSQVSHNWIDGKLVMQDRQFTGIDSGALAARIQHWQQKIGANPKDEDLCQPL
ncbi:MAG: TRZ/ATZ family hydrolase [Halieaceae bacterium]|jgi:5-methylthioadenosine/S-adenosylhomocysteine deaminase|nr:TRZ/ATZ family hydrolase [Halieaceae bacterium]